MALALGLPGKRARSGRDGPGRAWRARLGAIIQIGQIICLLIAENTTRVQIIGQIGVQRGKHQIIGFFGKRSILSNIYWYVSNNIANIPIIQEPNYWSKNSNNIAKIPIIQLPNYWSIIGPNIGQLLVNY